MLTKQQVQEIVKDITFRDWTIRVGDMGDGWFINWAFIAPDSVTGQIGKQYSRKWYISPHALPDEVVKTAWAALERAILHEVSEQFMYKGQAIFNRHVSLEAMLEASKDLKFRPSKKEITNVT